MLELEVLGGVALVALPHPLWPEHGDRPAEELRLRVAEHLRRRPVGERDGQDVPGIDAAHADEVGDAMGDDPGLAAAGSGQDQQGPVAREDGVTLGRVQVVEEVLQGR